MIDLKIESALTVQSVRQLLASASDKTHTQLRVTKDGIAFISSEHTGSDATEGLAFRLETFSQGADLVGREAAKDNEWVERIYRVLRDNWPTLCRFSDFRTKR